MIDAHGYTAPPAAGDASGRFVLLTPTRLLDTRSTHQALGPGGVLALKVAGSAGVPTAGAEAAVLNVAMTNPRAAGYLTGYPCDAARPAASDLNFVAGETVPNLVVVRVGQGGAVDVYNAQDTTAVVVVAVGYYR